MYDLKVKDFFGLEETKGNIGIEVETEFDGPFSGIDSSPNTTKYWKDTKDNSLKGYSTEYVLKKPVNYKSVPEVVNILCKHINSLESNMKPSIRTGIHIHINMQDSLIKDVFKFLIVYYCLETILTNNCGENRQGNLFCLRTRDAEYVIEQLKMAVTADDIYLLRTDDLRYTSLNIQSLFSFGSLELRSLATTKNLDNIVEWAEVLKSIKTE